MKQNRNRQNSSGVEISLRQLIYKVAHRKLLFITSLIICGFLAYAYIKITPTIFQASTTLLIDASGKGRTLGENQQFGGIGLIDVEKNLNNEINIISSYNLIKQALNGLDFNISYFSKSWYTTREHYKDFPFTVELVENKTQLYNTPIYVQINDDETYTLSIETKSFYIGNSSTESLQEIEQKLEYSEVHQFNELVSNNLFNFTIKKSEYFQFHSTSSGEKMYFVLRTTDDLTQEYYNKLQAEQLDINATILKLSTTGEIVEKEIDFLKTLTEEYKNSTLRARGEIASNKENFIRNQLQSVSDSLAAAELNLENFKSNKQAVDLSTTASSSLNQVAQLQSDKAKIELNREYYNSLLTDLINSENSDELSVPSIEGIDDPVLNENFLELERLSAEKARKRLYVTESNQEIVLLNRQIQFTKESIKESLRNLIQSSELAINQLNTRISRLQGIINVLPNRERQLLSMTRRRILYENLFNYLSQELAGAGIARADNILDMRVLDSPRMEGSGAIKPRKSIIMLISVFIGFMLPLGWVVYFDNSEQPITNRKQIENYSKLPVIASIAHADHGISSADVNLNHWRLEESFRDLSANVQYMSKNKLGLIIGITSTIPNEGKTFCAVKLGATLAKSNKKVLLIDTDFRNPEVINKGSNGKVDLANYIFDSNIPLNAIIHKHKDLTNFYFIQTGITDKNPHQLLTSERFHVLLKEVKEKFDYVLIDSPPLGIVSDYLLFTNEIDLHLFVLRRNSSKFSFIDNILLKISEKELSNAFLVYNDDKGKHFKYGYSNYRSKVSSRAAAKVS